MSEQQEHTVESDVRCRQFWRYTGQGEAPEQVALECNLHGVIEGVTAADSDERVADVWADHLCVTPPAST